MLTGGRAPAHRSSLALSSVSGPQRTLYNGGVYWLWLHPAVSGYGSIRPTESADAIAPVVVLYVVVVIVVLLSRPMLSVVAVAAFS